MSARAAILVCSSSQRDLARTLGLSLPVAGVVAVGRGRLPELQVDQFPDLDTALREDADCVCILAPYSDMAADVRRGLENGCSVLTAGPLDLDAAGYGELEKLRQNGHQRLKIGGRHRFSDVFRAVSEQHGNRDMGESVYMRCIGSSSGSLLSCWWALCEMLDQAVELLGSDVRQQYVTATRRGNSCHALLTAVMSNRASAQLVALPAAFPCNGELSLLTTAGLLTSRAASEGIVGADRAGLTLYPEAAPSLAPETRWVRAFVEAKQSEKRWPDAEIAGAYRALLKALRTSLRRHQLVVVKD